MSKSVAFTIVSKNFLAFALTLHASLCKHNPNVQFFCVICDTSSDLDIYSFPFEIIRYEELGIPGIDKMLVDYNITELNTALKPFAFSLLFDRFPEAVVYYFDPDIFVYSRLDELFSLFDDGANAVLTPHITRPAEYSEMSDQEFLRYGIYNLGFCAFRNTSRTRYVMSWWGRRLETHCIIDLENGLFVDQKWADLIPAFVDDTRILRHPGYNVAYWNLPERRVKPSGNGWTVNGQPLRFFHFSGGSVRKDAPFSRHSKVFTMERLGPTSRLVQEYRDAVRRFGHEHFEKIPYAFSWGGAKGRNIHTPQQQLEAAEDRKTSYLPTVCARSLAEYDKKCKAIDAVLRARVQMERDSIPFAESTFKLEGFCSCCSRESLFTVSELYASGKLDDGRTIPNWREHLDCEYCKMQNRMRGAFKLFEQELLPAPDSRIYITEQVTQGYRWLRERYADVQGSEYLGPDIARGEIVNGIRNEDVQALSFENDRFDYVLSFEVLEHVPLEKAAFRELCRVTAPGGHLIMTAPFSYTNQEHVVRCALNGNGELEHFLEPEYHGNPLDQEGGSLCFRYYGWKVLDDLKAAGYADAYVLYYWSRQQLHFGPQHLIIARK